MAMYDRSQPTSYRLIDRFDGGVGWLAYPNEAGRRATLVNRRTQLRALVDAL